MNELTTRALPPVEVPNVALTLVVVEGQDAGSSLRIDQRAVVGTSRQADLVLTDPTVSRRHITIEPAPLGVRVQDAGSRNGTWVETIRVHDIELGLGDQLRIGETRLRLDESPEAEKRDTPTPERRTSFGRFVGSSDSLQPVYAQLEAAAKAGLSVLLEGESGVGKELLAEAVHELSPHAEGPFVVVDCASLPTNLIEAELFGHERGAFTGAERKREGAFERADRGTVFLDEIGELPLAMQTRLLRVLDRRQVQRLGSSTPVDVNVQVIAATNRNLEKEVEEGRFRLDLFHRLAVVMARVPPLRERGDDIDMLARHFARELAASNDALDHDTLARIRRSSWPGNVRQLRHYVERSLLIGDSAPPMELMPTPPPATGDSLLALATSGTPYRQARAKVLEAFSRAYTQDMLDRHNGNVSRAARAAGIARRYFQRLKAEE